MLVYLIIKVALTIQCLFVDAGEIVAGYARNRENARAFANTLIMLLKVMSRWLMFLM